VYACSSLVLHQDAIDLTNVMFHAPPGIFQCRQAILMLVQNLENLGNITKTGHCLLLLVLQCGLWHATFASECLQVGIDGH
jgi:hypothetical protein